jgi:two-component system sensor histidine kinase QseC
LSDNPDVREINKIQQQISEIPKRSKAIYYQKYQKTGVNLYHKMQFQAIKADGSVLLKSQEAPNKPLTQGSTGFTNKWINNKPWRIFSTYNPDNGLTIAVAERYDFRRQAEAQITQYAIFIMLISYPFLGMLIWIVVDRGLDSVRKIAREVRDRSQSYLEPVSIEHVPREIQPLINELNHLFGRLNDALEREKRFASDAAHELKTPIAALHTQLQVAQMANDEQTRQQALQKALKSIKRSNHVVQQLLTLSRTVPGAMQEHSEKVDLVSIARDIISELEQQANQKNTTIDIQCPKPAPTFMGHPTAVGILLRNLTDNAIRYTEDNSSVIISIENSAHYVLLKVADNGPGIPEKLYGRVFERFFRVVGEKSKGSGLGLGIVQQIARLHEAEVYLDKPSWGKGLMVCVKFPKKSK